MAWMDWLPEFLENLPGSLEETVETYYPLLEQATAFILENVKPPWVQSAPSEPNLYKPTPEEVSIRQAIIDAAYLGLKPVESILELPLSLKREEAFNEYGFSPEAIEQLRQVELSYPWGDPGPWRGLYTTAGNRGGLSPVEAMIINWLTPPGYTGTIWETESAPEWHNKLLPTKAEISLNPATGGFRSDVMAHELAHAWQLRNSNYSSGGIPSISPEVEEWNRQFQGQGFGFPTAYNRTNPAELYAELLRVSGGDINRLPPEVRPYFLGLLIEGMIPLAAQQEINQPRGKEWEEPLPYPIQLNRMEMPH